jgi:hypothetical protein
MGIDIDIENYNDADDDDNNDQIEPIVIDTNLEFSQTTLDQFLLDRDDDFIDISIKNPESNNAWNSFQQQIQGFENLEYLAIVITKGAAQGSTKRYGKITMKRLL